MAKATAGSSASQTPASGDKHRQSTLMGFFGKPKPGPAPKSTSSQITSSVASSPAQPSFLASSPPVPASSQTTMAGASSPIRPPSKKPSPLKSSSKAARKVEEDSDELTPPPDVDKSTAEKTAEVPVVDDKPDDDAMDIDDDHPVTTVRHTLTSQVASLTDSSHGVPSARSSMQSRTRTLPAVRTWASLLVGLQQPSLVASPGKV